VCAAVGIKLPAQRHRALALAALVTAWTKNKGLPDNCPEFPEKKPTGEKLNGPPAWVRAEVETWRNMAGVVQVGKDKYELKPRTAKPHLKNNPPEPELPPQDHPPEGDLFGEIKSARMAGILAEWTSGKPTEHFKKKYSVQELLDAGIPKSDLAAAGIIKDGFGTPGHIDLYQPVNQSRLAEILTETFNEVVYPMRVKRALEKGMPGKQKNQSIIPAIAIPWWEKNERTAAAQGTLLAEATEAELQGKIKREAHEQWVREMERRAEDKNFVRRDAFYDLMAECGVIVYGTINRFEPAYLKAIAAQRAAERKIPDDVWVQVMELLRGTLPAAIDALRADIERGVNAVAERVKKGQ